VFPAYAASMISGWSATHPSCESMAAISYHQGDSTFSFATRCRT
jgi:hypothetical protein